ncbi:MAG: hypothetical protein J0L75_09175 [Spirochaetes bacterium]|nr:hypothetical protein [Spirochaetota bacterium]
MQASRIVSFILTAAAVAALVACTPQDRSNVLDPLGAGSNALADSFSTQKLTLTQNALWDKNLSIAWTTTALATNFRVYISSTPTRPTTASVDNVTNTNVSVALAGSGSNFIWVEAVALTANSVSAFLTTNFQVPSGWKIDGSTGAAASPSVRCINVPPGQARVISFPANVNVGSAITGGKSFMKTISVTGSLEVQFFVTNNIAWGAWWTNSVGNVASFTLFSTPGGNVAAAGTGICAITVKNISDTDGFNAIWIDDLAHDGAPANYQQNFGSLLDANLTGDKEK